MLWGTVNGNTISESTSSNRAVFKIMGALKIERATFTWHCTMSKLWKQGLKWPSLNNYFSTDFQLQWCLWKWKGKDHSNNVCVFRPKARLTVVLNSSSWIDFCLSPILPAGLFFIRLPFFWPLSALSDLTSGGDHAFLISEFHPCCIFVFQDWFHHLLRCVATVQAVCAVCSSRGTASFSCGSAVVFRNSWTAG